jgi:hypothetical protein
MYRIDRMLRLELMAGFTEPAYLRQWIYILDVFVIGRFAVEPLEYQTGDYAFYPPETDPRRISG